MKLEDILYDKESSPAKIKRELEKIYDRVEIEYRDPPEPLFQFNLLCYDENDTIVSIVRYGYSNNCNMWFFEDVTTEDK